MQTLERGVAAPIQSSRGTIASRAVTPFLIVAPAVALAIAIPLLWGRAVTLLDLVIAVALYERCAECRGAAGEVCVSIGYTHCS